MHISKLDPPLWTPSVRTCERLRSTAHPEYEAAKNQEWFPIESRDRLSLPTSNLRSIVCESCPENQSTSNPQRRTQPTFQSCWSTTSSSMASDLPAGWRPSLPVTIKVYVVSSLLGLLHRPLRPFRPTEGLTSAAHLRPSPPGPQASRSGRNKNLSPPAFLEDLI